MSLKITRTRAALAAGIAAVLALSGCSASSGSSGKTEITWLIEGADQPTAAANAIIAAFEKQNPDIVVKTDSRPGGTEGDNLIKTRLSTGDMADVFTYNPGSLFQALSPDKTLTVLSDESWVADTSDDWKTVVSTSAGIYGAPFGTTSAGGFAYSKAIYEKLGLSVPTTWDELVSNSEAIKAAGIAPIIQTYGDTWTSQLMILADFGNVQKIDPDWAKEYTLNQRKYADEPALESFQHLHDAFAAGLFNSDFASATYNDAAKMLAEGTGAQYPITSGIIANIQQNFPDAVDSIGFFALPAADAADTQLTVWQPTALYIPNTTKGDKLAAAKKLLAFVNSSEGCAIQADALGVAGPFAISSCALPDSVPPLVTDINAYVDSGASGLALEFLSPIKGPNLENIAVEVGSGISDAKAGAAQYDEDVKKQAQQLGLPGW